MLSVVDPGLMTTVQDLGRVGAQRLGIPVSGAMDRPALILANRLVGNDPNAAGLEATLRGPVLEAMGETCVAVTGAEATPRLNGQPILMWEAVRLHAGDRLSIGLAKRGVRLYLAAAGGIDVRPVLGSRSTYVAGRLGGLEGRPLQSGDSLSTGVPRAPNQMVEGRRVRPDLLPNFSRDVTLRVILGPQDEDFTQSGLETFLNEVYTVTPEADRMGCRLRGPVIEHARGHDIISEGVAFGSVQVAGDGQPIILLADRQTTGGYAKIATVISVDLPLIAQARPGDRVRFQAVSLEDAHRLLREHAAGLASFLVKK
jgi:biotin-dependent carboxylase-like uncharacterized protein